MADKSLGVSELNNLIEALAAQAGKGPISGSDISTLKSFITQFRGGSVAESIPKALTAEQAFSFLESIDFDKAFGKANKDFADNFKAVIQRGAAKIFSSENIKPFIDRIEELGKEIRQKARSLEQLKKTPGTTQDDLFFAKSELDSARRERADIRRAIALDVEANRRELGYPEQVGFNKRSRSATGSQSAPVDRTPPDGGSIGDSVKKVLYGFQEMGEKGTKPFTLFDTIIGDLFLLQEVSYSLSAVTQTLGYVFVKTNADLEQYLTTLQTTLGTAERAKTVFNEFAQAFALEVPFFQTSDLIGAINKLAAEGFSQQQLTGNLDPKKGPKFENSLVGSIVDAAAAFGKTPDEAVDAFIAATQNRFTRLRQFGISREDLKSFGFAGNAEDSAGAASAQRRIFQIRFGGVAQALSGTFKGALSNLQDFTTTIVRLSSSKSFEEIKKAMVDAAEGASSLAKGFTEAKDASAAGGQQFKKYLEQDVGGVLGGVTKRFISFLKTLNEFKLQIIAVLTTIAVPVVSTRLASSFGAIGKAFGNVITRSANINRIPKELLNISNILDEAKVLGAGKLSADAIRGALTNTGAAYGLKRGTGVSQAFVAGSGNVGFGTKAIFNTFDTLVKAGGPNIGKFAESLSSASRASAQLIANGKTLVSIFGGIFKFSLLNSIFEIIDAFADLRNGLENTGRVRGLRELQANLKQSEVTILRIVENIGRVFSDEFRAATEDGPFLSITNTFLSAMNKVLESVERVTSAFRTLTAVVKAPFELINNVFTTTGNIVKAPFTGGRSLSENNGDSNSSLLVGSLLAGGAAIGLPALLRKGAAAGGVGVRENFNLGISQAFKSPFLSEGLFGTSGFSQSRPVVSGIGEAKIPPFSRQVAPGKFSAFGGTVGVPVGGTAPTSTQSAPTTSVEAPVTAAKPGTFQRFGTQALSVLALLTVARQSFAESTAPRADLERRRAALDPLFQASLSREDRVAARLRGIRGLSITDSILSGIASVPTSIGNGISDIASSGVNAGVVYGGIRGSAALAALAVSKGRPDAVAAADRFVSPIAAGISGTTFVGNLATKAGERIRGGDIFSDLAKASRVNSGIGETAGTVVQFVIPAAFAVGGAIGAATAAAPTGPGAIIAGAGGAASAGATGIAVGLGAGAATKDFINRMEARFAPDLGAAEVINKYFSEGAQGGTRTRIREIVSDRNITQKILRGRDALSDDVLANDLQLIIDELQKRQNKIARDVEKDPEAKKESQAIAKKIAALIESRDNLRLLSSSDVAPASEFADKIVRDVADSFGPAEKEKRPEARANAVARALAEGKPIPGEFLRDRADAITERVSAQQEALDKTEQQIVSESLRGNFAGAKALRAKKSNDILKSIEETRKRVLDRANLIREVDFKLLGLDEALSKAKETYDKQIQAGVTGVRDIAAQFTSDPKALQAILAAASQRYSASNKSQVDSSKNLLEQTFKNAGLTEGQASQIRNFINKDILKGGAARTRNTIESLTKSIKEVRELSTASGQEQTVDVSERIVKPALGIVSTSEAQLKNGSIGVGEYLSAIRASAGEAIKTPDLFDPAELEQLRAAVKTAEKVSKEAIFGRGSFESIEKMNEALDDALKTIKNINKEFEQFGNASEGIKFDTAVREANALNMLLQEAVKGTEQFEKIEEQRNAAINKTISSYERLLDLRRKDIELLSEIARAQEESQDKIRQVGYVTNAAKNLPTEFKDFRDNIRADEVAEGVRFAREAGFNETDSRNFKNQIDTRFERIAGREQDFADAAAFRSTLAAIFGNENIGQVNEDAMANILSQNASDLIDVQRLATERLVELENKSLDIANRKLEAQRKLKDSINEQKRLAADLANQDVQKVRSSNNYFESVAKAISGDRELPRAQQNQLTRRELLAQRRSIRDQFASGVFKEDAQKSIQGFAESISAAREAGVNVEPFVKSLKEFDRRLPILNSEPNPLIERKAAAESEQRLLTNLTLKELESQGKFINNEKIAPKKLLASLENTLGKDVVARVQQQIIDRDPDKFFNLANSNKSDQEIFARAAQAFKAAVDKFVAGFKDGSRNAQISESMTQDEARRKIDDPNRPGVTGQPSSGRSARVLTTGAGSSPLREGVGISLNSPKAEEMIKMSYFKGPINEPLNQAADTVNKAKTEKESQAQKDSQNFGALANEVKKVTEAVNKGTQATENNSKVLTKLLEKFIAKLDNDKKSDEDQQKEMQKAIIVGPPVPPKRSLAPTSGMTLLTN